jgi:hypothetical protein
VLWLGSAHHENLATAVRGSILSEPSVAKRATIIHSVLSVIQQLLHYDNYGSAAALHKALSSPSVLGLRKTRYVRLRTTQRRWQFLRSDLEKCSLRSPREKLGEAVAMNLTKKHVHYVRTGRPSSQPRARSGRSTLTQ